MADQPKRPSIADLAREAKELRTSKPAVPPTYPGRIGFGKLLVPPRPERVPLAVKSEPEATRVDGVLQPAPASAPTPPPASLPPSKRSMSPPPAEKAVTPDEARIAREAAKAAAAAQDAIETEQRRALKPSALDQLSGWLGSPRGKATIALVGTLAAGGGWAQLRDPLLALLGIESVATAQERDDRQAKRINDLETLLRDERIRAGELEKRIDAIKTAHQLQGLDIADLNRRVPEIKAKPNP